MQMIPKMNHFFTFYKEMAKDKNPNLLYLKNKDLYLSTDGYSLVSNPQSSRSGWLRPLCSVRDALRGTGWADPNAMSHPVVVSVGNLGANGFPTSENSGEIPWNRFC